MPNLNSESGMVTAPIQIAADVGIKILKEGGNAFDAAVATAFCCSVVDPGDSGFGGGGLATLYTSAEDKFQVLDFNCTCPTLDVETAYPMRGGISEYTGYATVEGDANVHGYKSISVPGFASGMEVLIEKFGTKNLKELIEPSIKVARNGFPVSRFVAGYIDGNFDGMREFSETFKTFASQSTPYEDYSLYLPEYATTLEILRDEGLLSFYDGKVSKLILDAMEKNGGLLSSEGMASFKAQVYIPARSTYRDYGIFFPSVGSAGPAVAEALNILESFDIASMRKYSAETIHLMVESLKLTWADRLAFDADPAYTQVPMEGMLSKKYARKRSEAISKDDIIVEAGHGNPWEYYSRKGEQNSSPNHSPASAHETHTCHINVVDKNENFIALTQTLWGGFGSLVTIPKTGIVMNNGQSRFDPDPKSANKPIAGKRVLSNMCPALMERDGLPFTAVGSPGGRRIVSTLLIFLSNFIDFKMNSEALNEPRFHCETREPILVEPSWIDQIPIGVPRRLEKIGHKLQMIALSGGSFSGYPYLSGPASAIVLNRDSGKISGTADSRQPGAISGY